MKQFLGAVMMVLVGCAGGDVGRCTRDSQCPDNAYCDDDTGVCVQESDMRDGGGNGGSGGGSPLGSAGGTANAPKTKMKTCTTNADCPGGGICGGADAVDISAGVCMYSCGTVNQLNQAACPAGLTCVAGSTETNCVQFCDTSADCSQGLRCEKATTGPNAGKSACTNYYLSPASGACSSDADCTRGLKCNTSVAGGFCSALCGANRPECPGYFSQCITVDAQSSLCLGNCLEPGKQSNCRAGQTCHAVQGQSEGVCF